MATLDKLEILGPAAEFDTCNDCCSNPALQTRDPWRYIYHAALPSGGMIALFKVLMTNVCRNDCAYCVNQNGRDIPHTTANLYQDIGLKRVYFSAFRPVSHSRLEHVPPTSPLREHRLYQTDWLLRVYDFPPQELELALNNEGNLSLTHDPKTIIAHKQPGLFSIDIEEATYAELLRVPGIGPISARRIIQARKEHSIVSVKQLGKMGVTLKHAVPFIRFKSMLSSERQFALPLSETEMLAPVLA